MASLNFGSLGDIVTVCGLVKDIVQALSKSRGSAAEYQTLVRELQSLSQAVFDTHLLLKKHPHLEGSDRLRALLKDCGDSLDRELDHTEPYRAALQSRPTASDFKVICQKIRWLASKDERTRFRASVARHMLALSTVITISGINTQYQFHNATVKQLEQGFQELKLVGERSGITHEADMARLEDSIQEVKTTLTTRHDHIDRQALARYAEIDRKLEALHMVVSKHHGQSENSTARVNSSVLQNRVYLMLIISLLKELTSVGLTSVYSFLQLVISHRALHFFLQSKCLLVEDAILRQFTIDVDLMSYETFTKVIEDRFASTPGEIAIISKQYFFEDKKRHRLSLDGVWSSDILRGRTVFMRARITTPSLSKNFCPACTMLNEEVEIDKEISCVCGCKYTTTSGCSAIRPVFGPERSSTSSTAQVFSDTHERLGRRAYNDDEVAKFFKRVEKRLQQTPSAQLHKTALLLNVAARLLESPDFNRKLADYLTRNVTPRSKPGGDENSEGLYMLNVSNQIQESEIKPTEDKIASSSRAFPTTMLPITEEYQDSGETIERKFEIGRDSPEEANGPTERTRVELDFIPGRRFVGWSNTELDKQILNRWMLDSDQDIDETPETHDGRNVALLGGFLHRKRPRY